MKHIYKLNVKSEEAKRVREDIREHKLKRKLFKSIYPSGKWLRAYREKYYAGRHLTDGFPDPIDLDV